MSTATALKIEVGAVVYNRWGFDQTNVDFYEVMNVTPRFVTLRSLKQVTTETGFMCGPTSPLVGEYSTEKTSRHSYRLRNDEVNVKFEYGVGEVWDGKPKQSSWYA